MCEANVYFIDREGRERLVLESVDKVVPSEEGIFLENIFYSFFSFCSSIFTFCSIQVETLYSFLIAKDPSSVFQSLQQTSLYHVMVLLT